MKISQAKKKEGKYCAAYRCKNKPVGKKGGLCHKCYHRRNKERDPVAQRYMQFCSKAKARNIPNSVTLEEFRQFCIDNNYIIVKGRRGRNATIDRIRSNEGYYIGNMQILTNHQNSKKGNRDDCFMPEDYDPEADLPF